MASIRRQGELYEIRECRSTARGPRQFTLARFKRALTPDTLAEAASRAHRPFDAQRLIDRARARGIPVTPYPRHAAARTLLAELRAGRPLEPTLVAQLGHALAAMEERSVPSHLIDAADWIGQSERARGKALRGLLRTASRIVRSRGPLRQPAPQPFPRFSSEATS
jgi:hypothetical protein